MPEGSGAPVDAYHATAFFVVHGGREIGARIGERSAEIEQVLREFGAASGVFITGWNPRSRLTADAENAAATARMAAEFAERGIRWLPHVGRADAGDWLEEGFFALDLADEQALAIAAAFDQHAVVVVEIGRPAALLLTGV